MNTNKEEHIEIGAFMPRVLTIEPGLPKQMEFKARARIGLAEIYWRDIDIPGQ